MSSTKKIYYTHHLWCIETGIENCHFSKSKDRFDDSNVPKYPNDNVLKMENGK